MNIVADIEELLGAIETWRDRGAIPSNWRDWTRINRKYGTFGYCHSQWTTSCCESDGESKSPGCLLQRVWPLIHAVPVSLLRAQLDRETHRIAVVLKVGLKTANSLLVAAVIEWMSCDFSDGHVAIVPGAFQVISR